MDKAHLSASKTTKTLDFNELDAATGNIYEAIAQISRRAEQINETLRAEINEKLEDFQVVTDSLEEVFENKEQIEMSRQYESLPKPHAMAVREWLDGKVYYRYPEADSTNA
ncbi:MAG: DNA-directed RNA polymerase subunit omega [Schleiferiaceae bacterium]|jgi:DNA-directed RNA polymerase subunit K/omega|nr:DNA-directed RNA polymerase subunit omega [Bacteroidota bacterium]